MTQVHKSLWYAVGVGLGCTVAIFVDECHAKKKQTP